MTLVSPSSAVFGYTIPNLLDSSIIEFSLFGGGGFFSFFSVVFCISVLISLPFSKGMMANIYVVLFLDIPWTFKPISSLQ